MKRTISKDLIRGHLIVLRPPLLILGILASVALVRYFNHPHPWLTVGAVALANLAFNIFNEAVDADTDKIIKPHKPIPSGKVDPDFAACLASFFLMVSFMLLIFLGPPYYFIGVGVFFCGTAYNILRVRGIFGNLCLGGAYFSAAYLATYPLFVFAVGFGIFTIAFNIMVQLQDVVGDYRVGLKTFPIKLGRNKTFWTSRILAIIACGTVIASSIPYFPKLFFTIACLLIILNTCIFTPDMTEILQRKWTRVVLGLSFLSLLLG